MADQQELSVAQQLKKVIEETNSSLDERIKKQEDIVDKYRRAIISLEQLAEKEEDINNVKQSQIQIAKIEQELTTANYELSKLELQNYNEMMLTGKALLDTDRQRLKTAQQSVNQHERLTSIAQKAPEYLSMLFSGQGGKIISKGFADIGGSIKGELTENLGKTIMKSKSLKAAFGAIAPLAILGIFAAIAIEVGKLAVNLGNAENEFMKLTGANEQFARGLTDSFADTRRFGVSMDETSAAMGSLFNQFTDFTFQNENTRKSLTDTAAILAKMGVSTDTFAQSIQNMTKAMGMSADAAGQQMLNLEKFAEELGVAPSKLASDFAAAGGELAKFGDRGVDAFKDLAIASKITGIEVQRLLNITSAFDTFEGAAVQAGKLNAALGGNFVNAMDLMMETDPAARFEQIRDAISEAGLSFDEMSYYQQLFYKDALGLSDVGELARFMAGDMDMIPGAIQKSSQEFEEAAERAKTLASFQEQIKLLFVELVPVVAPVIDAIRSFISALQPVLPLLEGIGSVFGFIFSNIAIFYEVFYDSIAAINKSLPILKALGVVIGIIAIAFGVYLLGPIAAVVAAFFAFIGAIGFLMDKIFHVRNSPTFFEGLSMMPEMFSDLGGEIDVTSKSMIGMGQAVESTPIPAASETLAGATNAGTNSSSSGGDTGMQTVRQPMEISLNGDKLEKFIVQVTGKFIKDVSLVS